MNSKRPPDFLKEGDMRGNMRNGITHSQTPISPPPSPKEKKMRLTTEFQEDEESLAILLNDEIVTTLTYEDFGWSGLDKIELVIEKISKHMEEGK